MSGNNPGPSRHRNDYDEDQSNSFVITSQGKKQTSISSAAKRAQSTLRPSNVGGPTLAVANVSSFMHQRPTATERQHGKRLIRAQSQLRGNGRPKAMAAGVKIKTYRQEGERQEAQQPMRSQGVIQNLRIRETPLRVRKGALSKVILQKNMNSQVYELNQSNPGATETGNAR